MFKRNIRNTIESETRKKIFIFYCFFKTKVASINKRKMQMQCVQE